MPVHIWCPRPSSSAIAIQNALRVQGVRAYKSKCRLASNQLQRFLRRIKPGDLWINWGSPFNHTLPGVKNLNAAQFLNKKQQLLKLQSKGISTLEVSNTSQEGWLGRSNNHQEGLDLLNNTGNSYWTKKLDFTREVRVHVYKGLAIHTGLKVPRIDNPHPWIRSYSAGWKIDYSRANDIAQNRRTLAKQAIEALELDFGAVDIGVTTNRELPVVIEVNTAPGLDPGPSVEVYTKMFLKEL